jgi:hypothetical protein
MAAHLRDAHRIMRPVEDTESSQSSSTDSDSKNSVPKIEKVIYAKFKPVF